MEGWFTVCSQLVFWIPFEVEYCIVQASSKVEGILNDDKLDAIVCVAGGWAGGNASSQGSQVPKVEF